MHGMGISGMRGTLEVFWSSFLKLSDGFTKLGWSVMTIAGMLASFYLLSQAMKTLPWALPTPSGPASGP